MKTETMTTLPTVASCFAHSSAYWGERSDWLVAYSTTRDADCLSRSNWRSFLKLLGATGTEGGKGSQDITEHLAIEEASHWACGWIQYLVIHPDAAELIAKAEKAIEDLEDYPVLDEMDWSELEYDEHYKFFVRDCHSEFRSQLKDFELKDSTLDRIDAASPDVLMTWFESQIPSGEYQEDGYPNFSLAFDRATRDEVAALLRSIHTPAA